MLESNNGLIKLSSFLFILLYLSAVKLVDFGFGSLLGDIFLIISLMGAGLLLLSFRDSKVLIYKDIFLLLTPLLLITLIYFFNIFFTSNPLASLQRSFLIFLICISFVFFYKMGILDKQKIMKKYLHNFLVVIIIFIYMYYLRDIKLQDASTFFLNANSFGMYTSLLFLSLIVTTEKFYFKFIYFFLGFFLVFVSSSRTSLVAYFIAFLFMFLGSFFYRNKSLYRLTIMVLIFSALFVLYYMVYFDLEKYNQIMRDYTSKNLLSGRNEVWPYVMNLISQKPFLGWGGGVDLKDVSFYDYSSHNMYLHTALQIGIFGSFLIFVFYYLFWSNLWKYRMFFEVLSLNGIFIWLVLIQNFEVTLLQNNLAMSIPILCLLAYLMGNLYAKKQGY